MKIKAFLIFLIGLAFFCSCSTSSDVDKIVFFLNEIHISNKYGIKILKNNNVIENYYIDHNSYYDVLNEKTHYKFQYLEGFQTYDELGIIDNYIDEKPIDYIEKLYKLTNINIINSINFNIENNHYSIKNEALYKYDFSFINDKIDTFTICYFNDYISYVLKSEIEYEIQFYKSELNINPYNIKEEDIKMYYSDNEINFSSMQLKKENNDDFVVVLIDESCSNCKKIRKDLFLFNYEYNFNSLYFIDVNKLNDYKEEMLLLIKDCYDNQNVDSKLDSYDVYPNEILTPTMMRVKDKEIIKVSLGINVNALHDFCF